MNDESQRPPRFVPDPEGINGDFYRHAAQGRICFQRCDSCGAWRHPPRYLCAECGGAQYAWVPSSGNGKVFSWTVTHRPLDPGWAAELPYATLVVEMEEGVRVVGALKNLRPSELHLDLAVTAEIERVNDEFALIWFKPASRGPGQSAS